MSPNVRRKVVVLWANVGPYHLARCRALAGHCDLTLVEIASGGGDHGWVLPRSTEPFAWITLFERTHYSQASKTQVIRRIFTALRETAPEVLLVPSYSPYWSAVMIGWGWLHRRSMVLMTCSNHFDAPRTWWREFLKRCLVDRCDVALVGGMNATAYLQMLGMRPCRIFTGYNCVDNDFFRDGAARARNAIGLTRARHSLPEHYFFIPVRLIDKKNLDEAITAYARYRQQCNAPWALIIAGDGPLRPGLEQKLRKEGITGVELRPFLQQQELSEFYGAASALLLPSTLEQWGLVVNEAMAAGLPVLVSRQCGCAPDLVYPDVNGRTFDPFAIEDMVRALVWMSGLADSERNAMGAASQKIITTFSADRFGRSAMRAINMSCHQT